MNAAREQEIIKTALCVCAKIVEASLFWNSKDEEKTPELKTARTLAGYVIEINQQYLKEETEMSLSTERNNKIYTPGTLVNYNDKIYTVLAGPVPDYHGDNYYFVQNNDYAPISVCARNIFEITEGVL